MNSEIQKHIKKNKKNANAEVDIFNVNPQGDNTDKQAQRTEEEENDDYVIGGNIVNTDVANAHNQANLDVQKNIWEEKNEAIVYNETITVVEEPKKKTVAGWGDGVSKKKNVVQAINEEELYFPDLNNPNAKKQAPKPKPKPEAKNSHLFGDSSSFSKPKTDDRFTATNAIKFTNSKGQADRLNKLQATGPVYDANLEDDNLAAQNQAGEEPVKFKGKISLLGEETEADKQRAQYMREIQERQKQESEKPKTVWQTSEVKEESRFFNSKGGSKLNGFMRQDNNSNGLEDSAGKRQFTNSKKVNAGFKAPELDPSIPTVTNKEAVTAKVTLKGWD